MITASVSWVRHGGMETARLSHMLAFITLDMIPAANHASILVERRSLFRDSDVTVAEKITGR